MPPSNKPKAKADPAQAAPQPSLEELRYELALRVSRLANQRQWPACPRRACRRSRQCAATDLSCANPRPPRVLTPQEDAFMRARLLRDLRRRLAEIEREAG